MSTTHVRFELASGESMSAVLIDDGRARPQLRCYRITRHDARERSRHIPCHLEDPAVAAAVQARLAVMASSLVDAIDARGCRYEIDPRAELARVAGHPD